MSFGVTACLLSPPSLFPSCNLQLQQWDIQLQARPSFLLASPADTAAADSFCGVGLNTIDKAACLRPSIYPSMHCNATQTIQSSRGQEQSLILPLYHCTLSCYIFMDLKISIFSQGDKGPWIITIFLLASLDIIYYLIIVRKARPGLFLSFNKIWRKSAIVPL